MASDLIGKLKDELEKLIAATPVDNDSLKTCLTRLSEANITLKTLQSTGIGRVTNSCRKAEGISSENSQAAKKLISSWKDLASSHRRKSESGSKTTEPSDKPGKEAPSKKQAIQRQLSGSAEGYFSFEKSGHDGRDRARLMLVKGFKSRLGDRKPEKDPGELSVSIEESLFAEIQDPSNAQYKSKLRRFLGNITDPKNPDLVKALLGGTLDPVDFTKMSPQEMMSAEMRKKIQDQNKKAADKAYLAEGMTAHSTSIRCGKCNKNSVQYTQAQTRSADEPMTTFCVCNHCGNRWKFC
eukprot:m.207822 g.207822  ORF g.207822 m.207822 type:complete len:296 (+) comp15806_c0_seq7:121-1008(+)